MDLSKGDLAPLWYLDEGQIFRRGHQTSPTMTLVHRFFKEVSILYAEVVLILFVLVAKLKLSSSENLAAVAIYVDRSPVGAY